MTILPIKSLWSYVMNKADLLQWVLKNFGGIVIDLALENIEGIRAYLKTEAEKTSNKLDDYLVDTVVDWLTEFLEDLKDES